MLRVGLATFLQESNTFSPRLAETEDFTVFDYDSIRERFEGSNSELGGFLKGCAERRWQAEPLFAAHASSGGPLASSCFEELTSALVAAVEAQPIDGLLLALHGAMSTESYPSADAEVARRVRAALGANIPIAVTHDLHANVSPKLLQEVDALTGYRTYPHVDQASTGVRAAGMLARLLAGERPVRWRLAIPMLLPPQVSSTGEEPLQSVVAAIAAAFDESAGRDASLFNVQPWLDVAGASGSLVVTDFSPNSDVPEKLVELGHALWARRSEFQVPWVGPEALIEGIRRSPERPVLISEAFDSPSGGAAGDHTGLLRALLPHVDRLASCLWIVDGEVARQAAEAGAGAEIETGVGAKVGSALSAAVTLRARVDSVSGGEFTFRGPVFRGLPQSMGPSAVLSVGKLRVLVSSRPVFCIDPEMYRSQGIDPADQDAVGIKSPMLFRPAYEDISSTVVHLDLPGSCSGRFEKLPFRRLARPVWPLEDFEWAPSAADALRFE